MAVLSFCNGQTNSIAEQASKRDSTSATVQNYPVETTDGIIYFSNNNGVTWENKSDGLPDTTGLGLDAIAVSNNELGIATQDHGIYLFDFKKNLWVNIPTDKQIMWRLLFLLSQYLSQYPD